jgi:hypothetical protein
MLPGGEILTHQTLGTTLGKALQQQVDNTPPHQHPREFIH